MKMIKIVSIVLLAPLATSCSQEPTNQTIGLETFQDSVSYSYGVMLARNIKGKDDDIDPAVVAQGLKEALEDNQQLTIEQCQQVFIRLNKQKATEAGQEGVAYLEQNGAKEGVTITKSGLHYRILEKGTGNYPTATSKVTVHYTGTLIDGTEFDSTIGGDSISFSLSGVIAGWTEGLQLINEGGKIELVVPYQLGYGVRGSGPIPPSATLIFEVRLISIDN